LVTADAAGLAHEFAASARSRGRSEIPRGATSGKRIEL
jgi:hypothetical protein